MFSPMIFVAVALAVSSSSFMMARAQCSCYPNGANHMLCNGTSLTSIPACVPDNITALSIETSSIPLVANTIRRFPNLRSLYIGRFTKLQVTKTFLSGQPNINSVQIHNSDLAYIDNEWFQYAPKITILYFNDNKLASVAADTFRSLPLLDVLSVAHNQFTTLPPTLLEGTAIRFLSLRDNPWHCDCELANFMQWVRDHGVTVRDQALCLYPEDLEGLDITYLTPDIACK